MRTLVAAYLGIFLNMAALFMALPSWQEWLIVRSCADLSSAAAAASSMSPSSNATTTYDCGAHDAEVSSVAGNHYARLLFANTFVSFLTSGALSSVSDFVGRRGVLILCAATGVVLYVGWVGVVYFNLALAWFIPFHIVAGLGGGMATAIAVTISIIADTTTSAQRSLYVAAVLGIVYVSGMVGPLLGGYVTQYCPGGYLATFSIALGLQLGQLCVVVCILPESLPSTKRLPRPPLSLRTAAQFYFGPVSFVFTSSVSLALISALYALQYVVLCGTFSLLVLYVKMSKFDFTAEEVGHILTINYAAKSASVFLCIPIITGMWRCFSARSSSSGGEGGEKEIAVGGLLLVARIGFFIAAVMYVGYAVASNLLLMFVCAAIEGFDTMWESVRFVSYCTSVFDSRFEFVLSLSLSLSLSLTHTHSLSPLSLSLSLTHTHSLSSLSLSLSPLSLSLS